MKCNNNLSKMWAKVSCVRYDLFEGEISRKEAISQLEKLSRHAGGIVKQYEKEQVGLALEWQKLEITAELYAEMLRQKNNARTI